MRVTVSGSRFRHIIRIISADEVVNDTTSCDNFGLGGHGILIGLPKDGKTLLGHPKYSLHHIAGL